MEELKHRCEVDPKLTWDLRLIYKNEEEVEKDLDEMVNIANHLSETYTGKLNNAETIVACLNEYSRIKELINIMDYYVKLEFEVDHFNSFNRSRMAKAFSIMADVKAKTSFIKTEISEQSDDKRFRRWVLSNMVGKTYYHNFVTHLLEAAYQREVYRIVDAGGSVDAKTLNNIYKDILTKFWGDTVEIPEGAYRTWMRQPHYYYGLFSYVYSAGLTIATPMVKRLQNEPEEAVKDWKEVLKAGNTKTPIELAAMAKIDITSDVALLDTIDIIGGYIDEICRLTEEMENDNK